VLRDISDTALWVALYRARESERPDALFHDPFARRLAGRRGEEIARAMGERADRSWAFVVRLEAGCCEIAHQGCRAHKARATLHSFVWHASRVEEAAGQTALGRRHPAER
jgi:O-methyltransferase involved in polyketide biosynthesis